jgi:hypothetical protein
MRLHVNGKKLGGMVQIFPKIGALWSRLTWDKNKTLSQKLSEVNFGRG